MRAAMRAFIARRWSSRASCQIPSRTHPAAMASEIARKTMVDRFKLFHVHFVVGGVHAPALLHLHPHAIPARLRERKREREAPGELRLVGLHRSAGLRGL